MSIACSTVHGQLVSSMMSTSGPATSRAAATEATSVWWSLTAVKPWPSAAATAWRTSAVLS